MAAPTLTDLEWQYLDTGQVLNSQTSTLPFFDLTQISGLDLPDFNETDDNADGAHGGFVEASYLVPRLWILSGTAYGNSSSGIDAYLDTLRGNFLPQKTAQPLYFKLPGLTQRISYCKPVGCKYDYDQARRIGSSDVQIQLRAADPRVYDSISAHVNPSTITGGGNTTTLPQVAFTKSGTSWVLTIDGSGGGGYHSTVTFNFTGVTFASTSLTFDYNTQRLVDSLGNDYSSIVDTAIIAGDLGIKPGVSHNISSTGSATWTYGNTWL